VPPQAAAAAGAAGCTGATAAALVGGGVPEETLSDDQVPTDGRELEQFVALCSYLAGSSDTHALTPAGFALSFQQQQHEERRRHHAQHASATTAAVMSARRFLNM
jgi:hypothetical protein